MNTYPMRLCFFAVFSAVFGLYAPHLHGQTQSATAENRDWHGSELPDNALRLKCDDPVTGVTIDSLHRIAYIETRQLKKDRLSTAGRVTAYSLESGDRMWHRPINYGKYSFTLVDNHPMISGELLSRAFDFQSGLPTWRVFAEVVAGLDGTGTAMVARDGYMYKIDLDNGSVLWNHELTGLPMDGAMSIFGDTTMVVGGNGLTYVDLHSGKGWSVKGKGSAVAAPAGMMMGALVGGLIGAIVVGAVIAGPPTGTVSHNYLLRDKSIYFADMANATKCDLEGNVLWQFPLPKGRNLPKTVYQDSAFYIVRHGILNTSETVFYGHVSLTKIDETQETVRAESQLFGGEQRQYLEDFMLRDSSVVLAMSDRVLTVSTTDLSTLHERVFVGPSGRIGIEYVVNAPCYEKRDSTFLPRLADCPTCFFVENTAHRFIKFGPELQMESVVAPNDFFVAKDTLPNGLTVVKSASETAVIDRLGRPQNPVPLGPKAKVEKGFLVDFDGHEVVVAPWPK